MDSIILKWFNSWAGKEPFLDAIITFFAVYLWPVMAGAVFFLFLFSFFSKAKFRLSQNLKLFVESLVSVFASRFIITEVIRFFYDRPRPFAVLEEIKVLKYEFFEVVNRSGESFPSGHAALAFALAASVFLYYPKTGVLFFAGAFLIGLGRISAGVHWPTDILGGALVGIVSAYFVHFLFKYFVNKKSP